jgi:hypothetical protein
VSALAHLGAVALAGAVNLAATVALCRAAPRRGLFVAEAVGAALGLAFLAAALAVLGGGVADALVDLATYACAAYVLFHFNNMGETARRVRLARELAAAPDGLAESELVARYGAREMLDRRLARLVAAGQIRLAGDRLTIANPSVLWMARAVGLAKRNVLGARRERAWPDRS